MTWLDACREVVHARGLDPSLLEVLRAFGGDLAPGPSALDAPLPREALPERVARVLASEVDREQAEVFARRFSAVSALLEGAEEPEAPLLLVALYRRCAQILDDPPPLALRVRALVDFMWSQAAVCRYRRSDAPSLEDVVRTLETRQVSPGLRHGRLEASTRQGPVHLNVLLARDPRLLAVDARRQPEARGSLVDLARAHGAKAAISGGFFLYSEPDIEPPSKRYDPVGLLVSQGEVFNPPVFRRSALLQGRDGRLSIERVGMEGVRLEAGSHSWTVGDGEGEREVSVVHRAQARTSAGADFALSVVGPQVVRAGVGEHEVPLAGFVLRTGGAPPGNPPSAGDRVTYCLSGRPLAAGMAGGPLLIGPEAFDLPLEDFRASAPPLTFSQDETYDMNLLPRMGVGLRRDNELVVVAVDGRNVERAAGLTLRSTALVLETLGCERALNFDGGSSKRMVVEDQLVDLSTTEVTTTHAASARTRPIQSAILFLER